MEPVAHEAYPPAVLAHQPRQVGENRCFFAAEPGVFQPSAGGDDRVRQQAGGVLQVSGLPGHHVVAELVPQAESLQGLHKSLGHNRVVGRGIGPDQEIRRVLAGGIGGGVDFAFHHNRRKPLHAEPLHDRFFLPRENIAFQVLDGPRSVGGGVYRGKHRHRNIPDIQDGSRDAPAGPR